MDITQQINNCITNIEAKNLTFRLYEHCDFVLDMSMRYPDNYFSVYQYISENETKQDETWTDLKKALEHWNELKSNRFEMRFERLTQETIISSWDEFGEDAYLHMESQNDWAWTMKDGVLVDLHTLEDWLMYSEPSEDDKFDYELALKNINILNSTDYLEGIEKIEEQSFHLDSGRVDQKVSVHYYYYSL